MLGNPEVEAEGPYAVVLAPTRELAQQVRGGAAQRGTLGSPAHAASDHALPPPAPPRDPAPSRPPACPAPACPAVRQIEEETRHLAHFTDFRVVSVVGGQSIEDQGFALRWVAGAALFGIGWGKWWQGWGQSIEDQGFALR